MTACAAAGRARLDGLQNYLSAGLITNKYIPHLH